MMKQLNVPGLALALGVFLAPATASAVNPCYVDNNTAASYATPLHLGTTHNPASGQIACGHTVSGSGCTVELSTDLNIAYGPCVIIGRGVSVDGKGHDMHCTSSLSCLDPAILTSTTTPTGSGSSTVSNLSLSGCWDHAIWHQNSNNGIAEDITVNFPSSCDVVYVFGQPYTGGRVGIADFNTITRATISNAQFAAIELNSNNNTTINDSVVTNSTHGISNYGVTGTKIVNGRFDGNATSVYGTAESQGSAFSNATYGHCGSGSSLGCLSFTGTRASFVDYVIK